MAAAGDPAISGIPATAEGRKEPRKRVRSEGGKQASKTKGGCASSQACICFGDTCGCWYLSRHTPLVTCPLATHADEAASDGESEKPCPPPSSKRLRAAAATEAHDSGEESEDDDKLRMVRHLFMKGPMVICKVGTCVRSDMSTSALHCVMSDCLALSYMT